jgi:hypothetical protein
VVQNFVDYYLSLTFNEQLSFEEIIKQLLVQEKVFKNQQNSLLKEK